MIKILLLLLFAFHVGAHGAEITIEGVFIHVNGFLGNTDPEKFRSVLNESPQITTVVFENSNGGTVKAARGFADLISSKKLDTVVKGACHSGCAYAFLSGKKKDGALRD